MTDAREIIAYAIPGSSADLCFGVADAIIDRLHASGFRILGPDEVDPVTAVRPIDEWHEDYGDVVWWTWEGDRWIGEPSYIGTPNDDDWPYYHTHWSLHPSFPAALGRKA